MQMYSRDNVMKGQDAAVWSKPVVLCAWNMAVDRAQRGHKVTECEGMVLTVCPSK